MKSAKPRTQKKLRSHTAAAPYRRCSPLETLARLTPFLDSMGITRIANVTGLDNIGIPVVMVCRPNSRGLSVSQGKGLDLHEAKVSGLMEAAELFHAENIDCPLKFETYARLRRQVRVAEPDFLPGTSDKRFHPNYGFLDRRPRSAQRRFHMGSERICWSMRISACLARKGRGVFSKRRLDLQPVMRFSKL